MKAEWTMATAAILLCAGAALAAPTPQQKCDGARIKAWRKYVSCIENILAKGAGGLPVNPSEFEAFAKCRHKYFHKWNTLQGGAYTGSTCIGSRFTDNGDGTVTDKLSALTWEKKTDDGSVHDKDDNSHTWSTGFFAENGTVFTGFLDTVNSGGFGGANGWRLPTLVELQTILLDFPCTAASCACPSNPCVDPALDASTTASNFYWSATGFVPFPGSVWYVGFGDGFVFTAHWSGNLYVRAVRGGL